MKKPLLQRRFFSDAVGCKNWGISFLKNLKGSEDMESDRNWEDYEMPFGLGDGFDDLMGDGVGEEPTSKEDTSTTENFDSIENVKDSIASLNLLDRMIKELSEKNDVFGYEVEVMHLKERQTCLINNYVKLLKDYIPNRDWLIQYRLETEKENAGRRGENATAYKKGIDEKLIYTLWVKNVPVREIARQAKCSPTTVRRRVYKIQQLSK